MSRLLPAATTDERPFVELLRSRLAGKELRTIDDVIDVLQTDSEFELLQQIVSRLAPPGAEDAGTAYERHRLAARKRQAQLSAGGREIGPLPLIADPELRERCKFNLRLFLETCFPRAFYLGWSKHHLRVIKKLEAAILNGGKFALAMPRGRGKTTIFVRAVLWAIAYGHHRYALLVGANDDKADTLLTDIKTELRTNVMLGKLFPEICFPIRCLQGIANRAAGQVLHGKPTSIGWTGNQLRLPTIEGSPSSGAIIECGGILTAIRGAHYTTEAGDVLRPTLVLLDDPQTRESARSALETQTRYEILSADLAGLSGPDQDLSVCAAVTCIQKGDLSDTILDTKRSAEYRGERLRMVITFPERMDLWEIYFEIRRRSFASSSDDVDQVIAKEATDFYRDNREEMDRGAEVDWESSFGKNELTALQRAMNFLCEDEESFWAERQNEPRNLFDAEEEFATSDAIAIKVNNHDKREIPADVEYVTAFIDVHQRVLFWGLCGFSPAFEGYCLDYGVFPKQPRKFFVQSRARPTLMERYKGKGKEGAIFAGLQELTAALFSLELIRNEDGAELQINRLLIDAAWQTKVVEKFIRESEPQYRSRMTPAIGRGLGCQDTPFSRYIAREGEYLGEEWHVPRARGRGVLRQLHFDSNYWATFMQRRLATARGDRGCFSLYGRVGKTKHEHLAEHLTAEFRTVETGRRRADIWKLKPRTTENHWGDVIRGCMVGASVCGAKLVGTTKPHAPPAADPAGGDDRVSYPDAG